MYFRRVVQHYKLSDGCQQWLASWLATDHNMSRQTARRHHDRCSPMTRSREVSKSRDLDFECFNSSEIWQAHRQQCCRCACQILERYDNCNMKSRGFETSRDLTIKRLVAWWQTMPIHWLWHMANMLPVPQTCATGRFTKIGCKSNNC